MTIILFFECKEKKNLQTNHLASVSPQLPRELVRRQSRHCLNLRPTLVSTYAASEQVISLEFVLEASALQLLSDPDPRHKLAQGEPGATWSATTAVEAANRHSANRECCRCVILIVIYPGSYRACDNGEVPEEGKRNESRKMAKTISIKMRRETGVSQHYRPAAPVIADVGVVVGVARAGTNQAPAGSLTQRMVLSTRKLAGRVEAILCLPGHQDRAKGKTQGNLTGWLQVKNEEARREERVVSGL